MQTTPAPVLELPTSTEPAAKKKPRRVRSHVERFRTDDEEHTELHRLAAESGLSLGAFIRASTIGNGDPGPRSKRAPPTEQERVTAAHTVAVKRVGVNLNQGIQALNVVALKAPQATSRDRLADEIMATREILRSMQRAVDEALAADRTALGR